MPTFENKHSPNLYHVIKLIDKTKTKKEIPGNIQGKSAIMRAEMSDRSHMLEVGLFFSSHTTCYTTAAHLPSCGLLCVGSLGGPAKATAAAQKLYRQQTGLFTGYTGSFTQIT